jgi:hypothetical protein
MPRIHAITCDLGVDCTCTPQQCTPARNIAPGSRILNAGAPMRVVETWPVSMGFWRAFIVEDAGGTRHYFEIHRERPIALLDRAADEGRA